MPATFNNIGIGSVSASLIEALDVEKKIDHKVIKKSDGTFDSGNRFDPMFEFSVKGRGSAETSLVGGAGGSFAPSQVSGGTTIITKVRNSESNEDFNSFEVAGVNYPAAT
jgi:hypothetical protein